MPFLDRVGKGVGRAAEQAKFEARKRRRIGKLNSELQKTGDELRETTIAVGVRAIALRKAGRLELPEFDELIRHVDVLQGQLAEKKAQLEAAKAERFEEIVPQAQPVEEAPAPAGEYCPSCFAPIDGEVRYCPSCGQRVR